MKRKTFGALAVVLSASAAHADPPQELACPDDYTQYLKGVAVAKGDPMATVPVPTVPTGCFREDVLVLSADQKDQNNTPVVVCCGVSEPEQGRSERHGQRPRQLHV